jgi:RNA polymerase sigma-70 factor, ECF subfamily
VSRGLPNFKGRSQVSTWIYRIATNAAIDRLRKPTAKTLPLKGEAAGPSAGRAKIEAGGSETVVDEKSLPAETSLIEDEMLHCLLSFINKLPAGQRAVVTLSFFESMKNAEIAEILGIRVETAKMRLHRARSRLVAELEVHCGWFRDARNHLTWDGRIIL